MAGNKEIGKTTAVETFEARGVNGESYRKSTDGLEASGIGSGSLEMVGDRRVNGEPEVNPEVLEHAIEVLETKNKKWYAYLTTRDFWFVLALGYVLSSSFSSILQIMCSADDLVTDKSSHSASQQQTHSPPSSSTKGPQSPPSKLYSTTSS
jgi:hypothetical protein